MSDPSLEHGYNLFLPLDPEEGFWSNNRSFEACLNAGDPVEIVPKTEPLHVVHLQLAEIAQGCLHDPEVEHESHSSRTPLS